MDLFRDKTEKKHFLIDSLVASTIIFLGVTASVLL
jgi:hypothetical protein